MLLISFSDLRAIYEYLRPLVGETQKATRILLTVILVLAFVLWAYSLFAPTSWPVLTALDALALTLILTGLGCAVRIVGMVFSEPKKRLGFHPDQNLATNWSAYLIPIVILAACLVGIGALLRALYYPEIVSDPPLFIADIRSAAGMNLTPMLKEELTRRLEQDSCVLKTRPQFIATPFPSYWGKTWLHRHLSRSERGVAVFGGPFLASHEVCSDWTYKGHEEAISAEWPGLDQKTAFQTSYCSSISLNQGQSPAEITDALDEVIWKIHILEAIHVFKTTGNIVHASLLAAHGAQEGRERRKFRAIVSSMLSGYFTYSEGMDRASSGDPCGAVDDLNSSIGSLKQAIGLNTEIEKELWEQRKKQGAGWTELYNHANMSFAKSTYLEAFAARAEASRACAAQR